MMIQASEFVQHQWWSILAIGFVLADCIAIIVFLFETGSSFA